MRLTGYQPQYFPRLHYFARMLDADVFTISDHVQFVRAHKYPMPGGKWERRKSYQADTVLKASYGQLELGVPVTHGGFKKINETSVKYDGRWPEKHVKGIQVNYAASRRFAEVFPSIEKLLATRYATLSDLNMATILWAVIWIITGRSPLPGEINLEYTNLLLREKHPFRLKQIIIKSEAGIIPPSGARDATDWIIDTCRLFGADEYLCGGTARQVYLDESRLVSAGIMPIQQQWQQKPYRQLWPKHGFMNNLSIIDLLMNVTAGEVRAVLSGGDEMAPGGAAPGSRRTPAKHQGFHERLKKHEAIQQTQ